MATAAINQKQISLDDMEEWFTSTSDTVDFSNPDGSISTITTYHKLTKEISAVGGNSAEISTVAANIASITNVSGNMTAVIDAKPQADRSKLEADRAEEAADRAEAAENTVIAQGNTQVSRVLSEGNTQVGLVVSSGDQQVSRVISEGGSQVALATAQADRAKDEADKASISASSIYGMSQAQFEAIREQNKEKYAASGFVHFGKHAKAPPTATPINEGLWSYIDVSTTNKLFIGRVSTSVKDGKSKNDSASINIAGVIFDLSATPNGEWDIKFPQAPDGKTTYNKSTGVITTHTTVTAAFNAQAADPTNVEVVTDRVDMWGFEAWLEEVNTTNPYVYPNGLIQSQATTMDGIATSSSARPVTYYAAFLGDTGSKGKGVNFFTLTDAQKKKVLGKAKNNLYYLDDGRLVQWRLRQRTIAGAGNRDWEVLQTAIPNAILYSGANGYLRLQGKLDSIAAQFGNDDGTIAYSQGSSNNPDYARGGLGLNGARSPLLSDGAECYFLVCGTVNRLNQGAYHPSFNPRGASQFTDYSGMNAVLWHAGNQPLVSQILQCFNYGYGYPVSGGNVTTPTIFVATGNIGGYPGRPDNRCYDAIYADGQGGVCRDMRYSANGVDSVDFAEADQRVKNGTYRGFEKLVFTRAYPPRTIQTIPNADVAVTGNRLRTGLSHSCSVGDFIYIHGKKYVVQNAVDQQDLRLDRDIELDGMTVVGEANGWYGFSCPIKLVISESITSSVGGSFLQTDVIGNPANILATPALANGWQGSWGGLPYGGGVPKVGTRKMIASGELTYSINNGATWGTGQLPQPNAGNEVTSTYSDYDIRICQYQAFSKQTENAVNAPVYGGDVGTGKLSATSWNAVGNGMVLLAESCAGVILKSNNGYPDIDMGIAVTKSHIIVGCTLGHDPNQRPEHHPIYMQAPLNNSPAFKALNYNVNLNQQAFIQYAYTELKHNGTNWGDDGKVTIVDNQSTKTDLNGNTVLVGTAKLKEPIGWIKNKV
jgi:hypothetical protein